MRGESKQKFVRGRVSAETKQLVDDLVEIHGTTAEDLLDRNYRH